MKGLAIVTLRVKLDRVVIEGCGTIRLEKLTYS